MRKRTRNLVWAGAGLVVTATALSLWARLTGGPRGLWSPGWGLTDSPAGVLDPTGEDKGGEEGDPAEVRPVLTVDAGPDNLAN